MGATGAGVDICEPEGVTEPASLIIWMCRMVYIYCKYIRCSYLNIIKDNWRGQISMQYIKSIKLLNTSENFWDFAQNLVGIVWTEGGLDP